jgi:hypothetical protein
MGGGIHVQGISLIDTLSLAMQPCTGRLPTLIDTVPTTLSLASAPRSTEFHCFDYWIRIVFEQLVECFDPLLVVAVQWHWSGCFVIRQNFSVSEFLFWSLPIDTRLTIQLQISCPNNMMDEAQVVRDCWHETQQTSTLELTWLKRWQPTISQLNQDAWLLSLQKYYSLASIAYPNKMDEAQVVRYCLQSTQQKSGRLDFYHLKVLLLGFSCLS